jgi:tRNA(adenine34) deaminase
MKKQLSPMERAFQEAENAALRDEVPVGACVVDAKSGEVIAAFGNNSLEGCDPTAHAEMLALRKAAEVLESHRLDDCDLYATLEPCPMCAAAISIARIRRLYFAAYDPKGGGVDHGPRIFEHPTCHHKPDVYGGIEEVRAQDLLRAFFKERRS